MATIKVEPISIYGLKSAITFSAEQTSQAANLVGNAISGISEMSFSAKYGLDSDLTGLKTRLNKQAQLLQTCGKAVEEAVNGFVQVDNSSGTTTKTAWAGFVPLAGPAVLTGTVLSLSVVDLFRKLKDILDALIDARSGKGDATIGGSGSSYQNQLPDWAKEYPDGAQAREYPYWATTKEEQEKIILSGYKAEDEGEDTVAYYNLDGTVACTYYTLRKLRERGLGFPFKSTALGSAGKDWYDNCIDEIPKIKGEDAIETLLSENGYPLENVVVSFPAHDFGENDKNPYGHVMLIDKVYKDPSTGQTMVSFSDNANLYDINGKSPICTWTLDDFKKWYIPYNGGMNGAILIGS